MVRGTAPVGGMAGERAGLAWPAGRMVGLLSLLVVAACSPSTGGDAVDSAAGATTVAAVEEAATSTTSAIDVPALVLESLSAEEKVGQLLMPMIFGTGPDLTEAERAANLRDHGFATPAEIVAAYKLGGVIYLASNIDTAEQLRGLSREMQAAAATTNGIGLLVAIDQEGGRVSRISDEVTLFPPASDLAGDPRLVREAGYVTGQQVQQQGINVVLAPVADVTRPGEPSFIGNRSYGDDPDLVASMVVAAVDGLQQSGVAAAVKHWPGHGATGVDSHERLPSVDVDRVQWEERDLVPFRAAIDEGVAIVLVGHLALPQLDPSAQPATVSPVLVNELLRDELGYDGVVMTDALNMGAVRDIPQGELVVAAVLAGIDVILIPPSLEEAASALNEAVADGRIGEEQLDRAVLRVLRLKDELGLLPMP